MIKFCKISYASLLIFTSYSLFGFTDQVRAFMQGNKKLVAVGSVAVLAAGVYSTNEHVRHYVNKHIDIRRLKSRYRKFTDQPVTRAEALTAALAGLASIGVYTVVQNMRGVHE